METNYENKIVSNFVRTQKTLCKKTPVIKTINNTFQNGFFMIMDII